MIYGLTFLVLLFALPVRAFVENVTHGYARCVACHISPAGGGLLNDYGRSLSKELMSTWGWKGSEAPLFGAAENLDWFKVGGDARAIQVNLENSQIKQGRFFLMQDNIELGFRTGKTWFIGAAGTQEGPDGTPKKGQFLSERHYLLWETSEDTRVRVGKFRLNFGLNDPNHTRVTKSALGFGANSETYNLEFAQLAENYEIFLSSSIGRIDIPGDPGSERSFAVSFVRDLNNKARLGLSSLIGESAQSRRGLVGVFTVAPFFENGVVKAELDMQRSNAASSPDIRQDLFAGYFSIGHQVMKGLLPYLFFEYLQQNLSDSGARQTAPGVGVQWLPLPHFELQAEYKRQAPANAPGNINNISWILFHFYL